MEYLVIKLKSSENLKPTVKKKYINSLHDETTFVNELKSGFITKFSNALGFKKYNSFEYETPKNIISNNLYAYPTGDVIVEFYIKKGKTVAHDDSFEYENYTIGYKWANFLKKIFPELEISIEKKFNKPGRKESITSHFLILLEVYPMCAETPLENKLSKDEIKAIEEMLNIYKKSYLKYKLFQYECSTCKSYNEKYPIHLELDISMDKSKKENNINKCFNCNIEQDIDKEFCEECEELFKDKIVLSIN